MEGKWNIWPKVRHEANVKCADTFIDAIPLLLRRHPLTVLHVCMSGFTYKRQFFLCQKNAIFPYISMHCNVACTFQSREKRGAEGERAVPTRATREGGNGAKLCLPLRTPSRAGGLPPSIPSRPEERRTSEVREREERD